MRAAGDQDRVTMLPAPAPVALFLLTAVVATIAVRACTASRRAVAANLCFGPEIDPGSQKDLDGPLRGVFWSLVGVGSAPNIDARLVAVLQHEASLLSRLERGDHVGGYRIGHRIGRGA